MIGFGVAAAESARISLAPGLTITTAIAEKEGDYESIKRILSRDEGSWLLGYSASVPGPEGAPRVIESRRTLHDKDLLSARTYRNQFEDGVDEDYPSTTALGASTQVLTELRTTGEATFSLVGDDGLMARSVAGDEPSFAALAQAITSNQNVSYKGTLQRKSAGSLSVLMNGRAVAVPVIVASGRFTARNGKVLDAELTFLDEPVLPLALQWHIGSAKLRVVRIDVPPQVPQLKRQLAEQRRVILPGLYFEFGSAVLRPESTTSLPAIVDAIGSTPGVSLQLEGHTDDVGDEKRNLALSLARAQAVRDALVKIEPALAPRLEATGFGEAKPVSSNATLEGRAQNRRVELVAAAK